MKNIKQALKVWEELGDVPVNDNDEIEVYFKGWEIGTDKFKIWHWIENTYNVSIANDLMGVK